MSKSAMLIVTSAVLLFVTTPLPAWGQCRLKVESTSPYRLQANEVWVNYGAKWSAWSMAERLAYFDGLIAGGSRMFLAATFNFTEMAAEQRECLRQTFAVMYDSAILIAVVNDLYNDPANTFISNSAMVFIARDKLDGKDIEMRLRSARENERSFYKRN